MGISKVRRRQRKVRAPPCNHNSQQKYVAVPHLTRVPRFTVPIQSSPLNNRHQPVTLPLSRWRPLLPAHCTKPTLHFLKTLLLAFTQENKKKFIHEKYRAIVDRDGSTMHAFVDSQCSKAMPRVSKGLAQSSVSSNLLQKDEQFQTVLASLFGRASSDFPSTDARISHFNMDKYCTAGNQTAVLSATNSTYTILESDLVPEGISAVDLPKLPLLSSHELSSSRGSVVDALPTVQNMSFMNDSKVRKRKQQPGSLNATSHHAIRNHECSLPYDIKQEVHYSCLKKPRLDFKEGVVLQKHIVEQLMQSQDSVQLQGQRALQKTLLQQNKLPDEHRGKYLLSVPQFQGVNLERQENPQMRPHLEQPDICQVPSLPPFDGVCSRRLMQYVYHLRHRPLENGIAYWRRFVEEYYAPNAKKRWCLSLYDNVRHHSSGVFPQAAVAQWHCNLCGSTSGRGFEVTSEVLPRLKKVSFEGGVIDEILFLDLPCERRFPSGLMMLEYDKAVQESVYEQLRVVREGKLRIIFTYDLKILSWEFCARHHEELLQRSFIVPQVSQLVLAAQKYQSTINGSNKVSPYALQEDCNRDPYIEQPVCCHMLCLTSLVYTVKRNCYCHLTRGYTYGGCELLACLEISMNIIESRAWWFLTTGRQLVRNFELELIDDLGFSKRYIRFLQIAGVVESMKDLMSFSMDNNIGPVECLNKYPRQTTSNKPLRGEGKEKILSESVQSSLTDHKKLMAQSPDLNNSNGCLNITCNPHLIGSKEEAPGKLSRQKTLTSIARKWKEEPSDKCNRSEDASTKPFQDPRTSRLGLSQDLLVSDLSRYNFSESSKKIQDYMLQKWLHEMISNRSHNQRICCTIPSSLQTKAMADAVASRYSSSSGQNMHIVAAASNRESTGMFANDGFIKREPDFRELVQNMVHDYSKSGNPGDNRPSYGWNV